jgi:hypothetical protein
MPSRAADEPSVAALDKPLNIPMLTVARGLSWRQRDEPNRTLEMLYGISR